MGLTSTIKKAVQSAFVAVGDLKVDVNYWQRGDAEIDSATRVVTSNDNIITLSVLFIDFAIGKVDNNAIRMGDVQIYFPVDDLSIEPEIDDYIEETESKIIWNVINKEKDPAEALWILQARKR